MIDKKALRASIIERRDALPPSKRQEASEALLARIRARPEWQVARTVLLYLGIKSEFDPSPLVVEALASGKTVVLPRIIKSPRQLEIRAVTDLATDLMAGDWGLQEPNPAYCREVAPEDLDFILVPGVAFDRTGQRLGYGAGYYDRLLAQPKLHACKVAALFLEQFVDKIPSEDHDIPVDLLILPDEDRLPE